MTAPAPDLGPDSKFSVHVVVDQASLLSLAHEPGSPTDGYLQIASDGAYLALEVRDLYTAHRLRDLTTQLVDRLTDADLRRRMAMDDHPSNPDRVVDGLIRETLTGIRSLHGVPNA